MLQIKDTNVLKGLAIMLMLIHHLFWKQNGLYDDVHLFGDYYVVNQIGIFSKVCVALFVFLSGYGLTVQMEIKEGVIELSKFYLHRFKKLYLNYWFIWLIFVPISVVVFGRTFETAFPEKTYVHVLLDIIGIHQWFYPSKPYSYNATWWFYSCIISLYLLFPFLYTMMKKSIVALILLAIVITFLPFSILSIQYYIVVFVLGMLIAKYKNVHKQGKSCIMWIVLLVLLCIERKYNKYPLIMDCFIIVALIYFYQSVKFPEKYCLCLSLSESTA